MYKFLFNHKKKISILIILIISAVFIDLNLFGFKDFLKKKYPNLSMIKEFKDNKYLTEHVKNDYNTEFLPNTQFEKLKLTKNKINFKSQYYERNMKFKNSVIASPSYGSFFIEIYKEEILLADYMGNIYKVNQKNIDKLNFKKINPIIVDSNFSSQKILDTFIYKDKIYISSVVAEKNCKTLNISEANINLKQLNFETFYKGKECGDLLLGGRIQSYTHNNQDGIIITTHGHKYNQPDQSPQNDNSIYGKIIFFDFKNKRPIIFSKGHRVSQGLYTDGDIILQTEHGPKGGDEINKIIFNNNYGWPLVSHGEKYGLPYAQKPYYKKNHSINNFVDPIFSFVPSIGISEIIKLPNTFSNHFQNNFILSSLNKRHLYRIKFDPSFNRVLFFEKIFIGERVRDLKFIEKLNLLVMAFEENGEIGILSNPD